MSNYSAPGQYNYPSQEAPSLSKQQGYPAPGQYNYPPQQPQQQQQQNYGGYPQQQQQQQQQYAPQPYAPQPYAPQQLPPQQYAAPSGYPAPATSYPAANPYPAPAPTSYPGYSSGAYGAYSQPYNTYGAYPSIGLSAPIGVASLPVVTPMVTPMAPAVGVIAPVMGVADVPYVLHVRGCKLDRKDVFSKSDPFLTLSIPRNQFANKGAQGYADERGGGSSYDWIVIHRTETHHDNQNPTFAPITLSLYQLCGGNLERPIKIECWDYDPNGNHDFIGSGVSTVREMAIMKEMRLVNKKRIGFTSTAGTLEIMKCGPA